MPLAFKLELLFAIVLNCSTFVLKVAVLKNRWLAKRLGGEMFAVVFKYEVPTQFPTLEGPVNTSPDDT